MLNCGINRAIGTPHLLISKTDREVKTEKLILNGTAYLPEELMHLCGQMMKHSAADADEFALYSFIHEWLSPSPFIEVTTSGSTNEPKKMTFRKEQLVASARMTCQFLNIREKMNLLLCLPAKYIAGKMMIVRAFISHANLITTPPSGNPLSATDERIDFTAMVPLQVQQTIAEPNTRKKFSAIPNVIIGSAALPPELEKELAAFPNRIFSTFAMTETLSHIALRRISGENRNCLYELLPGIRVTTDERGCMIVNAPYISGEPIITNDLIIKADEEHFRWLGRLDNVINSGGIKIYPETVEAKIAHLFPNIRFFIAGLPDKTLGQKTALVMEGTGSAIEGNFKSEIAKVLEKYETPREYIIINRFVETPNGKVKRKETLAGMTG